MAKKNIEISDLIKLFAFLAPFFVILGSFYNNGQGSVFGDVYFSSIGYQDTLLQLFTPLRAFVFLFTLVFFLVLVGFVFLFIFFLLGTVRTIVGYRFNQYKAKKRYRKNEILREKNINALLSNAELLAKSEDVSEELLNQHAKAYSSSMRWKYSEIWGFIMYDDFIVGMKKFLKKREPKNDTQDQSTDFLGDWYKKVNKNIFASIVLFSFFIAGLVTVVINFWRTDTVYLSFLFIAAVFFLYIALNLINWFMGVRETQNHSVFIQVIGLVVIFCISSIFMFLLGRDEAQAAILNAEVYEVFARESSFKGRLIASNHSGVLILEDTDISYIRWTTIQHLELIKPPQ